MTWLAAVVFVLALAINVKVTLDDPFVMMSDEAVAQTTGGSTSQPPEGTAQPNKFVKHMSSSLTIYVKLDAGGKWIIVEAGVEGAVTKTVTEEWDCCADGGNGCSSNNPAC